MARGNQIQMVLVMLLVMEASVRLLALVAGPAGQRVPPSSPMLCRNGESEI